MAKKVRRVRRRNRSRESSRGDADTRAQQMEEKLQEEYAYVLQDLRRMFILAAVMFILLIAANIVL